jgi:general secretion pathway protein D
MNAVLMVTKNPKYVERATEWVQRLERSDTSGTTVRVYRLKYGSAVQVAKSLNQIFICSAPISSTGDTAASPAR